MKVLTVQHPDKDNLYLSLEDKWDQLRNAKMFAIIERSMRFVPRGGRWVEMEESDILHARYKNDKLSQL